MARLHVYGDEAGNFDFSRNRGASTYFILTPVALVDHQVGIDLLELRRELTWNGVDLPGAFHAASDKQAVRNQVFELLGKHDFRVDTTILEKAKAQSQVRRTEDRFYKYAWLYHMKYVTPRVIRRDDELMVVAASITTKNKRSIFTEAVNDVIEQCSPSSKFVVACWPTASDPCLQVADYCCWAIQRKWESGDSRAYDLIKGKLKSEFELWRWGSTKYY